MDQFGKVLTIDTYGYDSNGDAVKTGTQEFDITNTQELGDLNDWLLGESDATVLNSQGQKVSQLQLMLDANRGTMSLKDVEDWYADLISSVLQSDTVTGSVDWQYQSGRMVKAIPITPRSVIPSCTPYTRMARVRPAL